MKLSIKQNAPIKTVFTTLLNKQKKQTTVALVWSLQGKTGYAYFAMTFSQIRTDIQVTQNGLAAILQVAPDGLILNASKKKGSIK